MSVPAALLIALISVGGLNLPAKSLSNKERIFPRDAADPRSIFVVTFSKSAAGQASEWTRRLLERQAKLAAAIYQVAVLEEVPGLIRSFVISALRRGVPQSMHDHFWVVATDGQAWQRCADSTSAEEPHVFVLDRRDRIVWHAHGSVSEDKLNELSALDPPGLPNKKQ
jgi:hypothetical protein